MATNPMGKSRVARDPYLIFKNEETGWEWRVLKSWQANNAKTGARWFCAVRSPFTGGGADLGDVYVVDVMGNAKVTYIDPSLPEGILDFTPAPSPMAGW
jgi:hypothetical protein